MGLDPHSHGVLAHATALGLGASLALGCAARSEDAAPRSDEVNPASQPEGGRGPGGSSAADTTPEASASARQAEEPDAVGEAPANGGTVWPECAGTAVEERSEKIEGCLTTAVEHCAVNPEGSGYVDCDGDGWDLLAYCGEDGAATLFGDCDDADPTRHRLAYVDWDCDGFSGGTQPLCVGDVPPMGYAFGQPQDCGESDAEIFPRADDAWGDGIDSDCDTLDAPACEVTEPVRIALADPVCADLPDIGLSSPRDCCATCGGLTAHHAFLGNHGGVAFRGEAILTAQGEAAVQLESPERRFAVSLEPGETTEEMEWASAVNGPMDLVLELVDEAGNAFDDCNPDNESLRLEDSQRCPCR